MYCQLLKASDTTCDARNQPISRGAKPIRTSRHVITSWTFRKAWAINRLIQKMKEGDFFGNIFYKGMDSDWDCDEKS